jgi:hypothetical protein
MGESMRPSGSSFQLLMFPLGFHLRLAGMAFRFYQVSLIPKSGPVGIQTAIKATAVANTLGRPQNSAAFFASHEYQA